MSLYRTLIFFNSLFTRYFLKDFDQQFLNDFIDRAKVLLDEVAFENSKEIVCLVDLIKKMFDKYRKKNDGVDHKSEVKSEHLVLPK